MSNPLWIQPSRKTPRRERRYRPEAEALERREVPAGGLDPTFSGDGLLTQSFDLGGSKLDDARAVAVQADGKIVVVGTVQVSATDFDFGVARFNPDGSPDLGFNNTGRRTVGFNFGGNRADRATAVAIQADGKILVAGSAEVSPSGTIFALARLNADGSLDGHLDGDGMASINFNPIGTNIETATGIAVQPDGKIVLVGAANGPNGDRDIAVARLKPSDGSLDTSFGGGRRTIPFDIPGGNKADSATAVTLQSDGRIVVVGFVNVAGANFDFAVARLSPVNGSLDLSFNGTGKLTIPFESGNSSFDLATAVAVQTDGKIVVAGTAVTAAGDNDFAVVRLNPLDGSPDTGFGPNGKRTISFNRGGSNSDALSGLAIQPDGRIVLAGSSQVSATNSDMALARLNPANGSLDPTFDGDGKQTVAFDLGGDLEDAGSALALQADGKLVLAGTARVASPNIDYAVARLLGLDPAPVVAPAPVASPPTLAHGDVTALLTLDGRPAGTPARGGFRPGKRPGRVQRRFLLAAVNAWIAGTIRLSPTGLTRGFKLVSPVVVPEGLGPGQTRVITVELVGPANRKPSFIPRFLAD